MNKLTIGMPVYNGASTIRSALDSLLNQTFGEFEIVISDNLSTDGTQQICEEYAARDARVHYVRQPRNLGPQMNFRFVLFEAQTPYFMWAAGDDLWEPTFIERNLEALERDHSLVMSQSRVLFTENGLPSHMATGTYALLGKPGENAARFFENPADNSRYYGIFRTEALKKVFPERPFFALDWFVSAATLRYGKHNEIPETLMVRDSSDPSSYARAVLSDHRFILWRIFPLLFMTRWLMTHRSVPFSRDLFYRLFKANLYLHFRFGTKRWEWLARRYLATNSLRQALGFKAPTRVPAAETSAASAAVTSDMPDLSGWQGAGPEPASGPSEASLVILADTGAIDAFRAIASALRLAGTSPVEIVLVAPPSSSSHARRLASEGRLTLVEVEQGATSGAMINAGVAAASAPELLILRSAAWYGPDLLAQLKEGLSACALVAPQILKPDGRLLAAGGLFHLESGLRYHGESGDPGQARYAFARPCDFAPVALAARREVVQGQAPFNASIRNFEMAVAEFCLRQRGAVGEPLYWPAARITCAGAALGGPVPGWNDDWMLILQRHQPLLKQLRLLESEGRPAHDRSRVRRLLFIDAVTPAPDQNAGSIEAVSQMKVYSDFGFRVTFVPESNFAHVGAYTEALQKQGIEAIYHPSASSVREVLETAQDGFDVVVLCRAYIADRYLPMVRELAPRAKVVFYTVDLHFLREEREAELSGDARALQAAALSKATELASVRGVDATIVHSTAELELLAREAPGANVHVLPLMRAIPERLVAPGPKGRRDVLFVGTYQHPPNQDAVVFFAKEVWPLVRRRLPDARFLIVGSAVTETVSALAGDGVVVLGFVPDLQPLLDSARISVAPLRFGAGLKGKVATTLQAGLPTVATRIATEGVPLQDGREVLIADTAEELAEAVVRLYGDDGLWASLAEAGFAFARREFSFEANVARIAVLMSGIGAWTLESDRILLEADLEKGDETFRPSKFWKELSAQHRSQLVESRLVSFKRTINNCYMQWLPGSFEDPRMTLPWAALKDQPSMVPIEIAASVQSQPDLERGVVGYGGFDPFANPDYLRFYAFFTGLVWYLMTLHAGDDLYQRLEEPELGMPIRLNHKGQAISQDLAQSLLEYYRIRELASKLDSRGRLTVMELGAGYGRLAYVLVNAWRCRYVIVDIPPTILVAKWYLSRVLPGVRIFGYRPFQDFEEVRVEIEQADLVFLSPNQLALLPDGFADISVSISSLHEMERRQADRYKSLLQVKTAGLIYFKQWTNWRNPVDNIDVKATDFMLEDPWRLVLDVTDRANVEFTELAWLREPRIP